MYSCVCYSGDDANAPSANALRFLGFVADLRGILRRDVEGLMETWAMMMFVHACELRMT